MSMTRREMNAHVDAALSILNDVVGCHERTLAHVLAITGDQWRIMRCIMVVAGWVDVDGGIVTLTGSGRKKVS